MNKYVKSNHGENVKMVEKQPNTNIPNNIFEHNTPKSWSNTYGYGNIKMSTSENKHYLSLYL